MRQKSLKRPEENPSSVCGEYANHFSVIWKKKSTPGGPANSQKKMLEHKPQTPQRRPWQ